MTRRVWLIIHKPTGTEVNDEVYPTRQVAEEAFESWLEFGDLSAFGIGEYWEEGDEDVSTTCAVLQREVPDDDPRVEAMDRDWGSG